MELRRLADAGLSRTLTAGERRVWSLDTGGDLAAAACGDGSVRVWSLAGDWTLRLNEEERRTWSVALNRNGTGWPRPARADSRGCGTFLQGRWPGTTGPMTFMLGFAADPDVLVSAAADGTIRSWSVAGQKQLAEIRVAPSLQTAAFDARSGMILAASASGTLAIQVPGANGAE